MIPMLALLLVLQAPASFVGGKVVFWSYFDGQRFEFVVTPDDVNETPSWSDADDAPPLPPRSAVRSARELLPRLVKDGEQWVLSSVTLLPVVPNDWIYLIEFRAPTPIGDWIKRGNQTMRVPVLMNGTAVVPTVTEDPTEGAIPEVRTHGGP